MLKERYTIKDFLPLIYIFVFVIATSAYFTVSLDLGWIRWMELFMGIFFLSFGFLKLIELKKFKRAYEMYDLIAMRVSWYGYLYPFLELSLGILYVSGLYLVFVNIFTIIITLISALGVYIKLAGKEKILCACLGAVFKVPMTLATLAEDLLMAGMATVMLVHLL